jgi:hypothetical protein
MVFVLIALDSASMKKSDSFDTRPYMEDLVRSIERPILTPGQKAYLVTQ